MHQAGGDGASLQNHDHAVLVHRGPSTGVRCSLGGLSFTLPLPQCILCSHRIMFRSMSESAFPTNSLAFVEDYFLSRASNVVCWGRWGARAFAPPATCPGAGRGALGWPRASQPSPAPAPFWGPPHPLVREQWQCYIVICYQSYRHGPQWHDVITRALSELWGFITRPISKRRTRRLRTHKKYNVMQ